MANLKKGVIIKRSCNFSINNAKDKKIRDIVHKFQQKCAYQPPNRYKGSVLDGRDIITVQVKDAMFKFFITASLKTRAKGDMMNMKLNKNIFQGCV